MPSPPLRTDEALQAVHKSNSFSSFDLVHRYLQLAMEESDINKTEFRASSTVCMSSFIYHLDSQMQALASVAWWNNAWGNQQFVTLLLYLNDICIFAPTIDDMLDWIELVFDRLKQFNLIFKPKKCQFFNTSVLFLGHILSANGISANPEKVEKVKIWSVSKNIKEVQSFLALASYYRQFINKFAEKAQCLHKLVGPTSNKQKKKARTKMNTTTGVETGPIIFKWTTKYQDACDALKESLRTAPVLDLSWFLQGIYTGDRCFFEWSMCNPITTGQGWRNLCNSIHKLILTSLRKIYVQL